MNVPNKDFLLTANKYDIPQSIEKSPGLEVDGKLIRSILLSTDLSYIQNFSADAIMAVNPFEKSNKLDRVIIEFAEKPVFCDVGGGLLREEQTIRSAVGALEVGASAVVITKPTAPEIIQRIRAEIDGPLIYTVMFDAEPISELIDAGVDILNVSTGEYTAESIFEVRKEHPEVRIMASGGPYNSTILETIKSGANAIVFNPPTATEILRTVFDEYRIQQA